MNAVVACPKCGHQRAAGAAAPAWQCPACGIAYHKYAAYLERAREAMRPPPATAPPAKLWDGSVWMLVATNVLTIMAALALDWDLYSLMLVYWGQSVIIGVANVFRMLALEQFSTAGFTMNDAPVPETASGKRSTAAFFAVHYGMFHAVYLVFLLAESERGVFDWPLVVCLAMFAANHAWSFRYNRELDARGRPNIGTMMFTPYLRIVPMHLTIILGGMLGADGFGLVLFGALKTGADVGMHFVEHAQLQKVRDPGRLP
ncbi:MAG: DUF6498-containing protein [Gammaproteobacteria bacterium]